MTPRFDVKARLERISPLGWRIYTELQRVDLGFMASSVAFQAFLSLLPLFVSIFLLVATVGGQAFAVDVLVFTESFLPEEARHLLARSITSEITANATSVISLVTLIWGALGLFTALKTAFSTIYETRERNSLLNQIRDALLAYAVILVTVTAVVGVTSLSILSTVPYISLISSVGLLFALIAVFVLLYYLFPDSPILLVQALPGAGIAAAGWVLLQVLFELYVRFLADPDIAGTLGTILVVLAWLYFGSYIVLFGALVNYTVSAHEVE